MDVLVRVLKFVLLIGPLLLAAVVVPLRVLDHQGLDQVTRLKQELRTLDDANRRIQRENEVLRRQIRAFHSDPEYVERIARDELGMVGPGEFIYQFPNKDR